MRTKPIFPASCSGTIRPERPYSKRGSAIRATPGAARLTLAQSYPNATAGDKRKPVPIPVKLGLLDADGNEFPLKSGGKPVPDGLVVLRKKKETFTFEDIGGRPMPSLLRGFSAPVRLNSGANDRDMLALIRWGQRPLQPLADGASLRAQAHGANGSGDRGGKPARPNPRFIQAVGARCRRREHWSMPTGRRSWLCRRKPTSPRNSAKISIPKPSTLRA